jgi:hypothetical protein
MLGIIPATMTHPCDPCDDLDLGQAQAYALDAESLDLLFDSYDQSLGQSLQDLQALRACGDLTDWQRVLHALNGYVGLMAGTALKDLVAQTEALSRQGPLSALLAQVGLLVPRLLALRGRVQGQRGRYH